VILLFFDLHDNSILGCCHFKRCTDLSFSMLTADLIPVYLNTHQDRHFDYMLCVFDHLSAINHEKELQRTV